MHMNGLNNKQVMRVLILSNLLILFLGGCADKNWAEVTFHNKSNSSVHVNVIGVKPDISPGNVSPHPVFGASLEYTKIHFNKTFTVEWVFNGEDKIHKQVFDCNEIGMSPKLHGSALIFTLTKDNKWEVKKLKKRYENYY